MLGSRQRHILFLFCSVLNTVILSTAIFTTRSGRLGDNLIIFSKAKWFSYTFQVPLYLDPFTNYNKFFFSTEVEILTPEIKDSFLATSLIGKEGIQDFNENKVGYQCSLGSQALEWKNFERMYKHFIEDPIFLAQLKKSLTPLYPLSLITIPDHQFSVALHIRTGGSFEDLNKVRKTWPTKFPPHSYFVQQLQKIIKLYPEKDIYVYIFTDDDDPSQLKRYYESQFEHNKNVTFACRQEKNRYNMNVIEDMYNMSLFDCLIRGSSHFSRTAQLIGKHTIIYGPSSYRWDADELIITRVVKTVREGDTVTIYYENAI